MKTLVKTFETPELLVKISNIELDIKGCKASFVLSTRKDRRHKWEDEVVNATMTPELKDWFSKKKPEKVQTGENIWTKTGKMLSSFQKYLQKRSIEFQPGILKGMSFESKNDSKDYAENPFKIIRLEGRNILSLVNIPSKKRTVISDPETGQDTVYYSWKTYKDEQGNIRRAFIAPKNYRRLVVQSEKLVEVTG